MQDQRPVAKRQEKSMFLSHKYYGATKANVKEDINTEKRKKKGDEWAGTKVKQQMQT